MINRRVLLGLAGLGIPGLGAFGYAAQTGRIDLFTPELPAEADLPPLPGLTFADQPVKGLTRSAFFSGVSLLNVWASWCPDCRSEHPILMGLSQQPGLRLYGLAADDTVANASAFLKEHGNPFSRVSLEQDRHYQRALKHRGVPQTYVFNTRGEFVDKITGVLTHANVAAQLLPAMERAKITA
jgi:cytochrome c biogenesis protein CcmG/thiol:disulfide interchange protein DsbE